jgi:hypothetical protein
MTGSVFFAGLVGSKRSRFSDQPSAVVVNRLCGGGWGPNNSSFCIGWLWQPTIKIATTTNTAVPT